MAEDQIFTELDMSGRSLAGENLAGALFNGCQLAGASFRGADLTGATFNKCIAFTPDTDQNTDFSFARLRETRFEHCDLTAAEFANVSAYDLVFRHCQLQGVNLAGADFRLPVGKATEFAAFTMTDCNFAYGDLSNTYLPGCILTDNRMIEVLLHNAVLDNVELRGSDLSNMAATGLSLKGADLRGAVFNNIDPRKIDLQGVQITPEQISSLLDPLGIIIDFTDGTAH